MNRPIAMLVASLFAAGALAQTPQAALAAPTNPPAAKQAPAAKAEAKKKSKKAKKARSPKKSQDSR